MSIARFALRRVPLLGALAVASMFAACSGSSVPPPQGVKTADPTATPAPGQPTPTPAPTAPGATPTPTPKATAPGATPTPTPAVTATPTPASTGPTPTPVPTIAAAIQLASGFYGNVVANIGGARELTTLANGDLLVGTAGSSLYIVPNPEGFPGPPKTFITLSESPAEGVYFAPNGYIYAATNTTIWRIPYKSGDQSEPNSSAVAIAHVRTGPVSPGTDGDVHSSTSVVVSGTTVYAGIGSSCNRCVEVDPTRASIQQMNLDGSGMSTLATRIRNPIALAINPATGTLWAGGAGQDDIPYGHPYEYFDAVTLNAKSPSKGAIDYGWPDCEENQYPFNGLGVSPTPSCANTVIPRVEFDAYATLIGAAFYPTGESGAYAFPSAYRGGAFIGSHGSWHCCPSTPPRVYYVPMSGDTPAVAVGWPSPGTLKPTPLPSTQWQQIMYGLGSTSSSSGYIARPTGIAIGASGSLFVGDDATGAVYRIRHH
jgi:glucose/arabinose dehydrogenase